MDINRIFYCKFCDHKAKTVVGHLHHFKIHRNVTKHIFCGLGRCHSSFRNESSFRSHVVRNHKVFTNSQEKIPAPLPMDGNGKLKCSVAICRQEFFDSKSLRKHMKTHMASGTLCPCPFTSSGCNRQFSSINSLSGHISKKHGNKVQPVQPEPTPECGMDNFVAEFEDLQHLQEELDVHETRDESLVALAQFYQKLEYKHMVPASVTQFIANEVKTLLSGMQRGFLSTVSETLLKEGLPPCQVSDILSEISQNNEVIDVCNVLRSVYLRKKFYEQNFHFVEPQMIPLENGSYYYYVPIDKTIQAAFKNKSWKFCIKEAPFSQDGVVRDFYDGETFKNNTFFQENPEAIPLILYQDGFELSKSIGPAKGMKHNLEGIYMAFGNLPAEIRYQKDSIQLVALCVKSDFSKKEIYDKITDDIITLQRSGIDVENVGNVKAGLAFVAGDNLGAHSLGGFVENFSRSKFFCRYCLLYRPLFLKNGGEVKSFPRRTVESYNEALQNVRVNPTTGKVTSCHGIKEDTPFNRIEGFHVCAPGLASCVGHDLLEGVAAYDAKMYIQYFVKKGWFKLPDLNRLLKTFPYGQEDNKDMIKKIKKLEKPKLVGAAWQIYNFIRLFPLMISDYVKDSQDPVWKLFLQLKEICQNSVAPEFHPSYVPSIQSTIDEYLIARREAFPRKKLRPKHHYTKHSGENSLIMGPLSKIFTLRFETKHSFFSRSWRSSNNSINILQTLSYKHEFLQSWVRSGGGVRNEVEIQDRKAFFKSLYSEAIQNVVTSYHLEECATATIKGTMYKHGHIVALRKLSCFDDVIQVGVIHLILVDSADKVQFVVKRCTASLVPKTGDFKLKTSAAYECVKQEDLLSYYPLHTYIIGTESFIVLRHAFINKEFEPL